MGQSVEITISRDEIVYAAYRDNLEALKRILPYLQDRHTAAKKYMNNVYVDKGAYDALFEHIQFCNKQIAIILGITTESIKP